MKKPGANATTRSQFIFGSVGRVERFEAATGTDLAG
jgi:hypothetical protein